METGQKSPAQRGQEEGTWTWEQLQKCGWASPQACLQHVEQLYVEYMASVERMSHAEVAQRHREYYNAWIDAARESLTALMNE